jgi:mercuric ion transport protein
MITGFLANGGLAAALAASTCCILPLSMGALGIGGASLSTLAIFASYQTTFRVADILMIAAAFLLVYRRPRVMAGHAACAVAPSQGLTKTTLWIGAGVMALVMTSGWWERFIV